MFKSIFGGSPKKNDNDQQPGLERRHSLSQSLIESFSGTRTKANLDADVDMVDKSAYKKQIYCTVCFRSFTTTFRQHHCRICANAVCSECSTGRVNEQRYLWTLPRVCDICYLEYQKPGDKIKKQKILDTLNTLCGYLLHKRTLKMEELERMKSQKEPEGEAEEARQREEQERQLKQLQAEAGLLADKKRQLQQSLQQIIEDNRKLQEKIHQID